MMFSYTIATTIARCTQGWNQLRSINEGWNTARDDDLYHAPSLKAAALIFARDTVESPLDTSVPAPESTDRMRLLIGIASTVGLVLLISLIFLLLWSRHYLHIGHKPTEHDANAERDLPITQEPKEHVSGLRPMLLPARLWSAPANWGGQRKSMTLPIHTPPMVRRDSMALPIHAPPKMQRKSMDLPIHAPPHSLVQPLTQSPRTPDSAYIPTASLRAARYQHTQPHIHPYTLRTHRICRGRKPIGAIAIHPPGLRTQLDPHSPPPTYAQSTFHSLVEIAPAKEPMPLAKEPRPISC